MDQYDFDDPAAGGREGSESVPASRPLTLAPPEPGRCPVCASYHGATVAHNRESLYYQLAFHRDHGRWPTWKDACAGLPEAEQALWREELARQGVAWE